MMALEHMPSVAGFDAEVRELVTDLAERVRIRERDRILAILDDLTTDRGISRYSLAEVKRRIGGEVAAA